jgi:enoyl-CoA hydratase
MSEADGASADELLVDRSGSVVTLTMNRPARLNALSPALVRRLRTALLELKDDVTCRVVVLTGAGRGFCSGADLKDEQAGRNWPGPTRGHVQTGWSMQEAFSELPWLMRRIPQPVIAVVNGVAAGGGMSLACAADIRLAEPGARFIPSFVRIGVSGEMGVTYLLPRLVGWDHAAEILYTGREIGAAEADQLGLVTRVVEVGEGLAAAATLAGQITELAPASTRLTKSLLAMSMETTFQQQIELENRTQIMLGETADYAEAVAAFAERRVPHFDDH